MSKTPKKKERGLGRGLSALMSDAPLDTADVPLETKSAKPARNLKKEREEAERKAQQAETPSDSRILHVAISRLTRNPDQPRRVFNRDKLDDLIASIQQKGVLQPILVREIAADNQETSTYQIVAGERRWQAALKAELSSVPIMVRDLSDRDVLEIGVIENVQRADLNPLEEALAYERLIQEFGRTQAEIATTIGKSRVHVANTVRLTGLTERARELLLDDKITAGHARALLAASDPDALVEAIIKNDWSVRQAEDWVKKEKQGPRPSAPKPGKAPDIMALEQRIQDATGFAADIRHRNKGGEIRLKYNDLDHMEALLKRLGLMSQ